MTDHEKALEAAARAVAAKAGSPWPMDSKRYTVYAQAAIAAYLAQREADGFVMVPVEATEKMIHQGGSSFDHPSLYMGGPSHTGRRKADAIYRAMIAARPRGEG
jgi:hypothetical protein